MKNLNNIIGKFNYLPSLASCVVLTMQLKGLIKNAAEKVIIGT